MLVVSPKKQWSFEINSEKNNIKNLPWIVREKGSGTRRVLEELILRLGMNWNELNVVLELPSNEAVREAVIAGAGVTVISENVVSLSIDTGVLRAINLDIPKRSFCMVTRRQKSLSDTEQALKNLIIGGASSQTD
jgi:DNA-binding transcriptional LysR family regulator